jgi:crossover junction endodeoxyribonuclease RusA
MITITLPWPPSVNHYLGRNKNRSFVLPKGISYRKIACIECIPFYKTELFDKRLSLFICAFPPDKRKRDLDNSLKCVLDALQYAEVYHDDCQIDSIYIKRMPDLLGQVVVKIEECKDL